MTRNIAVCMLLIVLVLILVLVSRGNAQTVKKNPFEMPKQHTTAHFRAPIVGRAVSDFMLHHRKLGRLCGRFDITDFSVGNTGRRMVFPSPILIQSLNWRKK
jgi:hypothetical protein